MGCYWSHVLLAYVRCGMLAPPTGRLLGATLGATWILTEVNSAQLLGSSGLFDRAHLHHSGSRNRKVPAFSLPVVPRSPQIGPHAGQPAWRFL